MPTPDARAGSRWLVVAGSALVGAIAALAAWQLIEALGGRGGAVADLRAAVDRLTKANQGQHERGDSPAAKAFEADLETLRVRLGALVAALDLADREKVLKQLQVLQTEVATLSKNIGKPPDLKPLITEATAPIKKSTDEIYQKLVNAAATVADTEKLTAILAEQLRQNAEPRDVAVVLSHGSECDGRLGAVVAAKALDANPVRFQFRNHRLAVFVESDGKPLGKPLLNWPIVGKTLPVFEQRNLPDASDRNSEPEKLNPADLFLEPAKKDEKIARRCIVVTGAKYGPPGLTNVRWKDIAVDAIVLVRKKADTGTVAKKNLDAWAEFCRSHQGGALILPVPDDAAADSRSPEGQLLGLYLRRLVTPY